MQLSNLRNVWQRTPDAGGSWARVLIGVAIIGVTLVLSLAETALGSGRPNIVLILADDLGWRDLGCYGATASDTPHLDRLAAEGMRFTDAYSPAPICSAARAAILTGRSPARLHFEFVTKPRTARPPARLLQPPPYTIDLPLQETTLAELLGAAGYETGFFGKWHVSEHHRHYLGWSPTHGPLKQGFAAGRELFGSHPYAGGASKRGLRELPAGKLPDDAMIQAAVDFLEQPRQRPFFLMVSQFYVHTPVRAPTAWQYRRFSKRFDTDDPTRERRAHYAAFVHSLDHYCGQLFAALERLELAEETLVVFTSDNGGHPEYASNAPLRGSKWNLYEGGIRVPTIVRWPGHVAAGATCGVPVVGMDLLPTLCDAAGVEPPPVALDGTSLIDVISEQGRLPADRALFWHFPYYHPEASYQQAKPEIGIDDFAVSQTRPQAALRVGAEKLLYFFEDGRGELYDLQSDLSERHDLAKQRPQRAKQLRDRLLKRLKAVDARLPKAAVQSK